MKDLYDTLAKISERHYKSGIRGHGVSDIYLEVHSDSVGTHLALHADLTAPTSMVGKGRLLYAIHHEDRDHAFAKVEDFVHLKRIAAGEVSPGWTFEDEITELRDDV